jgi:hypothetical protein
MNAASFRYLALFPLCLLGCDAQPEPGTYVDSLRVLAERADAPYASPGETVNLSALSFDPAGRPLSWAWAICVNPSSSDIQGCFAKMGAWEDAVLSMGQGKDSLELTIPSDALSRLPEPVRDVASVGVVSLACPGEVSFTPGTGGLPVSCREPGTGRELGLDEAIVGLKRIIVRETDRNQNPEIAGITFDGQAWPEDEIQEVGSCDATDFVFETCPAAQKHQLSVNLSPESFEAGQDEFGHAFSEQLVVQYYATEGIFENELKIGKEPQNGWVARKRASGQELRLWFVARDNRGGVSWAERRVRVR